MAATSAAPCSPAATSASTAPCFPGAEVNFRGAEFTGGEVNFTEADWPVPPVFDFPISGGLRDLEHDRDTHETGRHGLILGGLGPAPPPGVSLPLKKYPSQT